MSTLSLKDLYVDELKDLYDAENRLIKALPKLAEAAESPKLRQAFEEHLEQTKQHALRLEQIFEGVGEDAKRKKCAAMVGLIQEGDELMGEDYEVGVKDTALISAAQRVEHYEMAAYGWVRTWAGLLGDSQARALLDKTLFEEKAADEKLNELSKSINEQATESNARSAKAGRSN
jgi:ferritin-like metal-binding protein YciE